MSITVFLAVMLAALLHASWNSLVKHSPDKHLSMLSIVLGHAPVAIVLLITLPPPAPESWIYIGAAALLHVAYQFFLLFSYRIGDLTQVYPIARGVSPLIVAAVSVVFLGAALSTGELLAIGLIAAGIFSLVLVRGNDGTHSPKAAMMALGTGCFIAAYSLVDALGAREAGNSLSYYCWVTLINAAIFVSILRVIRPGTISRVFTEGRKVALIGGHASFVAYAIVVWAFTQAPIAVVTALRETSIVFALLIGVFFLRERLSLVKVFSTTITVFGAIVLRLSR